MDSYFKYKIKKLISVSKIVTIHYFELSKDFSYPAESHDFCELHYVDKGHVFCLSDNKTVELNQGELLFFKPMTRHRIITDKSTPSNVCVISFECTSEAINAIQNNAYKLNPSEKKLMSLIFEEANNTFELNKLNPSLKKLPLKQEHPVGSLQMIQTALEQLLIYIARKELNRQNNSVLLSQTYESPQINAIIEFMHKNIFEGLSLDELSKEMGYGKTYLCTNFKRETKKTIGQFFSELQIEKAKSIIRLHPDKSIEDISYEMNFSTPAYFCSVFKKISGSSPKEYSRMIHAFDEHTSIETV